MTRMMVMTKKMVVLSSALVKHLCTIEKIKMTMMMVTSKGGGGENKEDNDSNKDGDGDKEGGDDWSPRQPMARSA